MKAKDVMVVYGIGECGKAYVDRCVSCGLAKDNIKIVDSNENLWGGKYQDIEILNPYKAFSEKYDIVVISVSEKYHKEILQQLQTLYNVPREKIIYYADYLMLPKDRRYDIGNLQLINISDDAYGVKKYYDMWNDLYKKSLFGMNLGNGGDLENSGEINVLKMLKESGNANRVLFDVGANIGMYTLQLLSFFPNAHIHSFEPAKETFRILSENVVSDSVSLNNIGISETMGDALLYSDKASSGLASLYDRQLDYIGLELSNTQKVKLITLDYYCETNNISEIDFLKLDIEGNEYKALLGASKLLAKKRIGAIQIETGGTDIDARIYFRDFWNLLHEDFYIYRILKDGMKEIPVYEEALECFITANWLFIRK